MQYTTVFDISQQNFYGWAFFLSIAGGIAVVSVLLSRMIEHGYVAPIKGWSKKASVWFGYVICVFFLFTGGIMAKISYDDYAYLLSTLEQGQALVVQGCVQDFSPKLIKGRGELERFRVRGVLFEYSGSDLSPGFQQTAFKGGPIHEGLHVRISYVNKIILKLEVSAQQPCPG